MVGITGIIDSLSDFVINLMDIKAPLINGFSTTLIGGVCTIFGNRIFF